MIGLGESKLSPAPRPALGAFLFAASQKDNLELCKKLMYLPLQNVFIHLKPFKNAKLSP
jgi:hypothetical protein